MAVSLMPLTVFAGDGELEASGNLLKVTTESDFAAGTLENEDVEDKADEDETEIVVPAMKFSDVSASDWYYDSVKYVYENGLMTGTGAVDFAPAANTTRGQIVTILARFCQNIQ